MVVIIGRGRNTRCITGLFQPRSLIEREILLRWSEIACERLALKKQALQTDKQTKKEHLERWTSRNESEDVGWNLEGTPPKHSPSYIVAINIAWLLLLRHRRARFHFSYP